MRKRRDVALRNLQLMLVLSIALPVALFGYASWHNYGAAFQVADERNERARPSRRNKRCGSFNRST
jgi:hypothetical protein